MRASSQALDRNRQRSSRSQAFIALARMAGSYSFLRIDQGENFVGRALGSAQIKGRISSLRIVV